MTNSLLQHAAGSRIHRASASSVQPMEIRNKMRRIARTLGAGLLLLAVASCATSTQWLDLIGALASAPIVKPVGFDRTISSDRQSVLFSARLLNTGFGDATGPFTVEMSVSGTVPNEESFSAVKKITVPASSTIQGTQTAGPGGGTLLTDVIVTVPYHVTSTYAVQIFVDWSGDRFPYLEVPFKHWAWMGKLAFP